MDATLYTRIADRLDRDASMADHAFLVLAACEGRQALEDLLTEGTVPEHGTDSEAGVEPAGALLRSITVQGFRGIGPAATLEVTAGPGLTLVVGRNGSGKSSFAEGLEVLLTGDSYRWKDRVKVWRDGWRNLHEGQPASVGAELLVEDDRALTTVTRTWADDEEDVSRSTVVVQGKGKQRADLASLGWDDLIATFRPFLTYSELGSSLEEGPSKLYDMISAILGLGDLTAAEKALRDARLDRKHAHDGARASLGPLLGRLEEQDDERAAACLAALSGKTWDLETATARVVGGDAPSDEGELQLLRKIASIEIPQGDAVERAASSLEAAAGRLEELAGTDVDRAWRLADLLEQATELHERHGDGDCPVCGRPAAIDADWHKHSLAEIDRLRKEAEAARTARDQVDAAMSVARALLGGPPASLLESDQVGIESHELRLAWGEWQQGVELDDPMRLAEHLRTKREGLAELAERTRAEAASLLQEREDRWRPVAHRVSEWLAEARPATEGARHVDGLKKAEDWIKAAESRIRDERFEPIAKRAQDIWELLRAQSHVDLARPALEGTSTNRRVRLDITVDGVAGAALGVMSQGELNSLALSLFLPRVTTAESPFRFVVIDDPVQSMDPARVDGLARVLEETGKTRQVIVFTHDDRLPASIRRLGIDARVIEVTRRPGSVVELRPALDPVTRYIADAYAIVKTENLPETASRRVVPGLCRSAIEAACMEAFRRRRLGKGEPYSEVEELLERATTTTMLASLALFEDLDHGGDVLSAINARFGRREGDAFASVKRGAHRAVDGDLADLVRYSGELAKGIQAL